jgi:hypothetical protein
MAREALKRTKGDLMEAAVNPSILSEALRLLRSVLRC